MYLSSLCYMHTCGQKGLFLCVVGSERYDIDSRKPDKAEDNLCYLMLHVQEGEDVNHLLLHCQLGNRLRKMVLNWFCAVSDVNLSGGGIAQLGLEEGEDTSQGMECCPNSGNVDLLEKEK